jgi:hypothetical protein
MRSNTCTRRTRRTGATRTSADGPEPHVLNGLKAALGDSNRLRPPRILSCYQAATKRSARGWRGRVGREHPPPPVPGREARTQRSAEWRRAPSAAGRRRGRRRDQLRAVGVPEGVQAVMRGRHLFAAARFVSRAGQARTQDWGTSVRRRRGVPGSAPYSRRLDLRRASSLMSKAPQACPGFGSARAQKASGRGELHGHGLQGRVGHFGGDCRAATFVAMRPKPFARASFSN